MAKTETKTATKKKKAAKLPAQVDLAIAAAENKQAQAQLRQEIEAEQEQLQRRRVVNREAEPLRAALKQTWTEEAWQAKPLEYQRAILRIACECIEVTPKIGHGGAEKGQHGAVHNPDRIKVKMAG